MEEQKLTDEKQIDYCDSRTPEQVLEDSKAATITTTASLDKPWLFKQGESGNPNGRPKDTPEQKLVKKAAKQIIAEYKEALAEALPMIRPVLIAKALEGDISSIKEIHDRTMDKAKQPSEITGKDGGAIQVGISGMRIIKDGN